MKIINSKRAPAAIGPYSQAILNKDTLYVSGQLPLVVETMRVIHGGVEAQARQSLDNIKAIVEEAGMSLKNIVKVGIFCSDLSMFTKINEIYSEFFQDHKPARFCVEVSRLPKNVLVEMDCIAVK